MLGVIIEGGLKKRFEELFQQHFKPLYFHAMSFMKDRDLAKDIVHDVFLSVWEHRSNIDFSKPMLPYLISLIRNRCINYLAHQKVKLQHEMSENNRENILCVLEEDPGHEILIQHIMKRIDELPDRCGEVMHLYFIDCKKYKEIAELLGVSVNTVKTHISNGLRVLRGEFPTSVLLYFFASLK